MVEAYWRQEGRGALVVGGQKSASQGTEQCGEGQKTDLDGQTVYLAQWGKGEGFQCKAFSFQDTDITWLFHYGKA